MTRRFRFFIEILLNFFSPCGGRQFLQDTLDALFSIMMETSDKETYDMLVFNALVGLQNSRTGDTGV